MTPRRPRLLYLACYFPPLNTIACVRTGHTARYLSERGWEVTVVTPDPTIWANVEAAEGVATELAQHGIRRILTGHRWSWLQPEPLRTRARGLARVGRALSRRAARWLEVDPGAGWVPEVRQACRHLRPGDVDLILATGSPFASFAAARQLGRRLGCPYVLDYRDPWTGNPHTPRSPRSRFARAEAGLLRECAAAMIVSASWGEAMAERFPLGDRLHVVSNGYDPRELARVAPHDFGHFAIVYAGGFYPPKRVITPVIAALQRLQRLHPRDARPWRFHYYGDGSDHVRAVARELGVMDQVTLHGMVPRQEALAAVRGAGVAAVITSVEETHALSDRGMVTGKLFEAVGLGTPTLLVGPARNDAASILAATGLPGPFSGSDPDGMARFLADALANRLPRPRLPEAYSWPYLADRMDTILRGALAAGPVDTWQGAQPALEAFPTGGPDAALSRSDRPLHDETSPTSESQRHRHLGAASPRR